MAIALDSLSTATLLNALEPLTWTHTPTTAPDLVLVAIGSASGAIDPTISSVTYGATSMTFMRRVSFSVDGDGLQATTAELFYCASPGAGAKTVTVNYTTHTTYGAVGSAWAFTGVDLVTGPFDVNFGSPYAFIDSASYPSGVALCSISSFLASATSIGVGIAVVETIDGASAATLDTSGGDIEQFNIEGGTLASSTRIQVAGVFEPAMVSRTGANWTISPGAGWVSIGTGIKAAAEVAVVGSNPISLMVGA